MESISRAEGSPANRNRVPAGCVVPTSKTYVPVFPLPHPLQNLLWKYHDPAPQVSQSTLHLV